MFEAYAYRINPSKTEELNKALGKTAGTPEKWAQIKDQSVVKNTKKLLSLLKKNNA